MGKLRKREESYWRLFRFGRDVLPGPSPPKAVLAQGGGCVVLLRQWWKEGQRRPVLDRGSHKSTMVHVPFLQEEFALMVGKGQ